MKEKKYFYVGVQTDKGMQFVTKDDYSTRLYPAILVMPYFTSPKKLPYFPFQNTAVFPISWRRWSAPPISGSTTVLRLWKN